MNVKWMLLVWVFHELAKLNPCISINYTEPNPGRKQKSKGKPLIFIGYWVSFKYMHFISFHSQNKPTMQISTPILRQRKINFRDILISPKSDCCLMKAQKVQTHACLPSSCSCHSTGHLSASGSLLIE